MSSLVVSLIHFYWTVSRAVHLELVSEQTTERFLLALRRFIARQRLCKDICSDDAKTFKRYDQDLKELWKSIRGSRLAQFSLIKESPESLLMSELLDGEHLKAYPKRVLVNGLIHCWYYYGQFVEETCSVAIYFKAVSLLSVKLQHVREFRMNDTSSGH